MDQAVGFDELRWLQELTYPTQKAQMPELIAARLLKRKLIERKDGRCSLTPRGRIAHSQVGLTRPARERLVPEEEANMKPKKMQIDNGVGRVLLGPKKLRDCYARIVSQKDGSGRIEKFDTASGTWAEAHETVTFGEIWSAPSVPASPWTEIERKR